MMTHDQLETLFDYYDNYFAGMMFRIAPNAP